MYESLYKWSFQLSVMFKMKQQLLLSVQGPHWTDWTPQASNTGLGIGSSLKQMISCAAGVVAHVALTKYGWVKTLQSNLCSTLEWEAGLLNWCECELWHNALTPIQQSLYSIHCWMDQVTVQVQLYERVVTEHSVTSPADDSKFQT